MLHGVRLVGDREQETQWQLGACVACKQPIKGGSVVETKAGKYHRDCFKCAACGTGLASVTVRRNLPACLPACLPAQATLPLWVGQLP